MVEFFPYLYNMPNTSSTDAARDAAAQLTTALLHPHLATPFTPMAKEKLSALQHLAEIFLQATKPPSASTDIQLPPKTIAPPRVPNTSKTPKTLATTKTEGTASPRVQI